MADALLARGNGRVDPRPIESRAEVSSLDELHHERRQLMITFAPLKAMHGSFGMFDHRRKSMVEAMKVKARMSLARDGTKVTEAMVDAEGHGDPQYIAFLDQMERDKIEYLNQQCRYDEIEEAIRSREIEMHCYNAELKLAR